MCLFFFEKEGIDTADANGEFIITLMSSVAQEESRSISENIRWTFRKKFEEGIVSTPVKLLGYHAGENGELILDKNESLIVTAIFSLFLQGKTPTEISLILNLLSIPSIKGNTDHWVMPRIRAILSNEKYKGDAKLQKFYTVDFLTHKVAKKPRRGA